MHIHTCVCVCIKIKDCKDKYKQSGDIRIKICVYNPNQLLFHIYSETMHDELVYFSPGPPCHSVHK